MAPSRGIGERRTSAHDKADLYVDAVRGFSGEMRHHQPVVCTGSYCQVTNRIHAVDVTDWRCVTRLPPLSHTCSTPSTVVVNVYKRFFSNFSTKTRFNVLKYFSNDFIS